MNLTLHTSAKLSETQISLSLPGENMSSLLLLYLCSYTDRGQEGDKEDDADDMYNLMVSFGGFVNTLLRGFKLFITQHFI